MQSQTSLVRLLGGLFSSTFTADPNIVRLLKQAHARENVVILRDLVRQGSVHFLDCHACDRRGEDFLRSLYRSATFIERAVRAKRLPPGTVVRLRVTQRPAQEILGAINRYYSHSTEALQQVVQPHIAALMTMDEVRSRGCMLAHVSGHSVHAYYVTAAGRAYLNQIWSTKLRAQIAHAADLPPNLADSLVLVTHVLAADLFEAEVKRAFEPRDRVGPTGREVDDITLQMRRELGRDTAPAVASVGNENETAVKRLLDAIVRPAYDSDAADVFIGYDPETRSIEYGYKRDSRLVPIGSIPLHDHSHYANFARYIIDQANLPADRSDKPRTGRITMRTADGRSFVCRLAMSDQATFGEYRDLWTPYIVLRVLRETDRSRTLDELGLQDFDRQYLDRMFGLRSGLILFAGPPGVGKNETATAFVNAYADRFPGRTIQTVENPVERRLHRRIVQMGVPDGQAAIDYLAVAVRQNQDVLYVTEINDPTTADLVIKGASTSTLLLSTLHAENPFKVPGRLQELGLDPKQYAPALKLAATQRLVGRVCPTCRTDERFLVKYERNPKFQAEWRGLIDALEFWRIDPTQLVVSHGTGTKNGGGDCPDCRFMGKSSGIKGQTACFEWLRAEYFEDELWRNLPEFDLKAAVLNASDNAHRTLYHSAMRLAQAGIVSLEAIRDRLGSLDPYTEHVPSYVAGRKTFRGGFAPTDPPDSADLRALRDRVAALERMVATYSGVSAANTAEPTDAEIIDAIDAEILETQPQE